MSETRRVICQECARNGETSHVFPEGGITTDMYFATYYDQEGRYHNHDDNDVTSFYRCSRGHSWGRPVERSCWCGWENSAMTDRKKREET